MTTLRFDFQRAQTQAALFQLEGPVLNVGCNEDPANLKLENPGRVINCDLFAEDQVLGYRNVVDEVFDAARDIWPFEDREASLVVLGDILEHLSPDEITFALIEARRVSQRLCITVPCDEREENNPQRADTYPRGAVHRTVVTEQLLRDRLEQAMWTITEWREVEYDNGVFWGKQTFGFFVAAT